MLSIKWEDPANHGPSNLGGEFREVYIVLYISIYIDIDIDTHTRIYSACNARDPGLIPRSGKSPGEKHGKPLQYSCLENSVDRGAWWATVHGVTKNQTQLSNEHFIYTKPRVTTQVLLLAIGLNVQKLLRAG